jgi:hypothetical protein
MSPWFRFHHAPEKAGFSFAASLVAKGDEWQDSVNEIAEGSGMGVRGKGQSPFLCAAMEQQKYR